MNRGVMSGFPDDVEIARPHFSVLDLLCRMTYGGHVYIMTNQWGTTLYVGVTANLFQRVLEHAQKVDPYSFSARYNLNKLVYYESYERIELAIAREKQIKAGSRKKKLDLINSMNPNWLDLYQCQVKYWK
jgi:putative endonuclease